jgi:hypothetical protein
MKKKLSNSKSVEEALIDLYLNLKIRKQEEVFKLNNHKIESLNTNAMNQERENLKKTNPLTIIEYIKSSIDILIELKVEERMNLEKKLLQDEEECMNEYEALLRKLEGDIRQHIKVTYLFE